MNFWEARQAALDGKRVHMVNTEFYSIYNKNDFETYSWGPKEIESEWAIYEEPKNLTYYTVPLPPGEAGPVFKNKMHAQRYFLECEGLSVIEIITDKNGKVISARNV